MKRIYFLFAGLVLVFSIITPMHATTIAYGDPATTGNEIWTGNLGEDFTADSPIEITALGVYNSGQTGTIGGTLEVGIVASDGTVEVSEIFSGTIGTLIGGDLFLNLATPITLAPGDYSLTTTGWGPNILNGNANCAGGGCGVPPPALYTPPTLNDGGGALTFTGIGYTSTPGLVYLAPVGSYPADEFNAGSFQFTPTPEPATLAGVTLGLVAFLALRGRALKR